MSVLRLAGATVGCVALAAVVATGCWLWATPAHRADRAISSLPGVREVTGGALDDPYLQAPLGVVVEDDITAEQWRTLASTVASTGDRAWSAGVRVDTTALYGYVEMSAEHEALSAAFGDVVTDPGFREAVSSFDVLFDEEGARVGITVKDASFGGYNAVRDALAAVPVDQLGSVVILGPALGSFALLTDGPLPQVPVGLGAYAALSEVYTVTWASSRNGELVFRLDAPRDEVAQDLIDRAEPGVKADVRFTDDAQE